MFYTSKEISEIKKYSNAVYTNLSGFGFTSEEQSIFKSAIKSIFTAYGEGNPIAIKEFDSVQKNRISWFEDGRMHFYMNNQIPTEKNIYTITRYAMVIFEYSLFLARL